MFPHFLFVGEVRVSGPVSQISVYTETQLKSEQPKHTGAGGEWSEPE